MPVSMCIVLILAMTVVTNTVGTEGIQCSESADWETLIENVGLSAMHLALLPNDKFVIFDYTYSSHKSSMVLPRGVPCIERADFFSTQNPQPTKLDCWVHSVEFDPVTKKVTPMTLQTDTWCSAGSLMADGTLIQNGGGTDGVFGVRKMNPWDLSGPHWVESRNGLQNPRWYATNQVLPDNSIFVIGGIQQSTYEFIPNKGKPPTYLPFLEETRDHAWGPYNVNNLYPFVHLLPDGNLFIFANTKSILFDHVNNKVLKSYPDMPPRGIARNYPSMGSSVLLPLDLAKPAVEVEVMVCGGTLKDAYNKSQNAFYRVYERATHTCGRMKLTDRSPVWKLENMPMPRYMSDMVTLPTGDVLLINGASYGSGGWEGALGPVLNPVLYGVSTHIYRTLSPTCRPRTYHATAHVMRDGRVMVGGGNSHQYYQFVNTELPTEVSVQAFSPPYLADPNARPRIVGYQLQVRYGSTFLIDFGLSLHGKVDVTTVGVHVLAPTFTTHAFSMNQRMLRLKVQSVRKVGSGDIFSSVAVGPFKETLAPPGYYLLFVIYNGVPSVGGWIRFGR